MTERATCGFRAFCSRTPLHRGGHGGWRADVAPPAPMLPGSPVDGDALTEMQAHVLATLIAEGGVKEAATRLRRSEQTVKGHLKRIRDKTGAATTLEALLRLGWLQVPRGVAA